MLIFIDSSLQSLMLDNLFFNFFYQCSPYSKSSFTSPATCFECYDGTGTEMGRKRFQRWVGCNFGTLKKSCNFSSVNTFPPNLDLWFSIRSVLCVAVHYCSCWPAMVATTYTETIRRKNSKTTNHFVERILILAVRNH